MAVEVDVEVLKSEIKRTYASVLEEPEKDFIFPTGRAWAEDLDYPDEISAASLDGRLGYATRRTRFGCTSWGSRTSSPAMRMLPTCARWGLAHSAQYETSPLRAG